MHDVEYKSRLGSHAGFYFSAAGIAFLLWSYGFRGLLWRDAVYVVVGYILAAIVLGNVHWLISRWFEARENAKHGDISMTERLMGSERLQKMAAKGRRLGTLFTALALAVGLGSAFAYDFYFPR
jgi:hypothetical protein